MQWAWAQAGVSIPPTTYTQKFGSPTQPAVPPVSTDALQPGDLVFCNEGEMGVPGPGHVVMYVGGGQVVSAPHPGDVVKQEQLTDFLPYDGAARPPT